MSVQPKRKRAESDQPIRVEDIDFTLSDLERKRQPASYVVEKLSADRCRVLRHETKVPVASSESEACSSRDRDSTATHGTPDFSWDLADMDVDGLVRDSQPSKAAKDSKKRRYISSVRDSQTLRSISDLTVPRC